MPFLMEGVSQVLWSGDEPLVQAARRLERVYCLGQSFSQLPRRGRLGLVPELHAQLSWLREYAGANAGDREGAVLVTLGELEGALVELASSGDEDVVTGHCSVCSSELVDGSCERCLDTFLSSYNTLESQRFGLGTEQVGRQFRV